MGWDIVFVGLLMVNSGGKDKQELCLVFERSQEKLEEQRVSPQREDKVRMTSS